MDIFWNSTFLEIAFVKFLLQGTASSLFVVLIQTNTFYCDFDKIIIYCTVIKL